ncbi:DMP19 family protein [Solirubrobacter phytolaccae]|uniref:DMP19 family protein n=1 Tax=Solirubrobacter phytolaccae TaxID=1404360 RepID=A0A9X3S7P4_9ACTN|nr:DUF4375 domain-containing protein [Solirubrobacter phytolaccae]MDA0181249.1 DMP19 family protein [Solirubrobacter phytolaccae]
MALDHRVSPGSVTGLEGFDRLQRLHEAAVGCFDDRLDELTPGMRALTVLFVFCGEVDNGGFCSCMGNSAGDFTAEAIAAARLVGADAHAELFERFVAVGLAGDVAMPQPTRNARLLAMTGDDEAAITELDDAFYALPSIDEDLERYVASRPEEFFTAPLS